MANRNPMRGIMMVLLAFAAMPFVLALLGAIVSPLVPKAYGAETAPNAYKSLQPFERFAKGAGEGVAYEYKTRTKAQFVALLRDKKLAKDEMRVSCDVLVRQMAEVHPALPFEGCEGAAAAIERDDNFAVVACKDEMFVKDNFLTVTNEDGSAFGVWHRKCLQDEQVLVYKDQVLISLKCLNPAIPVSVTAPPKAPPAQQEAKTVPAATAACPKGIALFLNAWTMDAIYAASPDLGRRVDEKIKLATDRDSKNASDVKAYMADDVSGSLGDEIIRVVNVRAPLSIDIAVQLLNPVTLQEEDDLGLFRSVDGIDRISLSDVQRTKVVQMVLPAWFSSPTVSGAARRLLVLPKSWEKPNGGRWCTLQANATYWKANRP